MRIGIITILIFLNFTGFAQGPVAYYPFNGNANDESGNGNNGILGDGVNANTFPVLTTDRFGNANAAYSFDGLNDYIISSFDGFSRDDNITLSVWINIAEISNNTILVLGDDLNDDTPRITLRQLSDGRTGSDVHYSSATATALSDAISINRWIHLTSVVSWTGDDFDVALYVNGELMSSWGWNLIGTEETNFDVIIGKNASDDSYFNGKLDDIRIYDRALAESEILQLYIEGGYAIPDIEGNLYSTVKIGNQTWMAENLKTGTYNDGTTIPTVSNGATWSSLNIGARSWFNNDQAANGNPYGALYNWYALATGKLCPVGWEIPNEADLSTLISNLGGTPAAGGKLKEAGTTHWLAPNTGGTNESGFTAVPGGFRSNTGNFAQLGTEGYLWSSLESDANNAAFLYLTNTSSSVQNSAFNKNAGMSVRCLRETKATEIISFNVPEQVGQTIINPDAHTVSLKVIGETDLNGLRPAISVSSGATIDPPSGSNEDFRSPVTYTVTAEDGVTEQNWQVSVQNNTIIETGTVTDVQGNVYKTVKIGNQWWMAENMRSSKYADNSDLVDGIGAGDINSDFTTKYHFPANNSSVNVPVYGYLYTWAAAMNGSTEAGAQGVCPDGWHIPADDEFKDLERFLGMSENDVNALNIMRGDGIGAKLKEVATFSWDSPNPGSSNLVGYRAIPSGARNPDGSYFGFGTEFSVWTSNDFQSNNQAVTRRLSSDTDQVGRFIIDNDYALPVRCVNTDVDPPTVGSTIINLPERFLKGSNSIELSVDIEDNIELASVTFNVRPASQREWTSIPLALDDENIYKVTLQEDQMNDLGLLYYFEAIDASGNSATTDTTRHITFQYVYENSPVIPNLQAGGQLADWRMFSIPHNLNSPRPVKTIFEDRLGGYDKKSWRLLHYDNQFSETKFKEYNEGFADIEPGKGYWFNSIAAAEFRIGTSSVPQYNVFKPAIISLNQGWNQIGNPYIFNVDWQEVLNANGLTNAELESLRVYDGGQGLESETVLEAFSGAYVHSNLARNIVIPFTSNGGGRLATTKEFEEGWLAEFKLITGLSGNFLSGFGMHPEAKDEHDGLDRVRVPRFLKFIDASFEHPEFVSQNFGRDIVAEKTNYTWEFTVESNVEDAIRSLSWEITNPEEIENLLLYDVKSGNLIDMLQVGNYNYSDDPTRRFLAIYGDLEYVVGQLPSGLVSLGNNYPNPLTDQTIIPYAVYGTAREYPVQLNIYALDGSLVANLLNATKPAGAYQFEWDGRDASGRKLSGFFIYSLEVSTENGLERIRKKLIVR